MKQVLGSTFLIPLWTFIAGMGCLLVTTLFYPQIGEASTALLVATANTSANYPYFSWAVGSARFIFYIIGFFLVILSVGIAWLQIKYKTQ